MNAFQQAMKEMSGTDEAKLLSHAKAGLHEAN